MTHYRKILVATDLNTTEENHVIEKVRELSKRSDVEVHMVHVIEEVTFSYGTPFLMNDMMDWHRELETTARETLEKFGAHLQIASNHMHLVRGEPKDLVIKVAKEINADLIIVGSHGQKGLELLLLGSTANAILHYADCDVLAVRLHRGAQQTEKKTKEELALV